MARPRRRPRRRAQCAGYRAALVDRHRSRYLGPRSASAGDDTSLSRHPRVEHSAAASLCSFSSLSAGHGRRPPGHGGARLREHRQCAGELAVDLRQSRFPGAWGSRVRLGDGLRARRDGGFSPGDDSLSRARRHRGRIQGSVVEAVMVRPAVAARRSRSYADHARSRGVRRGNGARGSSRAGGACRTPDRDQLRGAHVHGAAGHRIGRSSACGPRRRPSRRGRRRTIGLDRAALRGDVHVNCGLRVPVSPSFLARGFHLGHRRAGRRSPPAVCRRSLSVVRRSPGCRNRHPPRARRHAHRRCSGTCSRTGSWACRWATRCALSWDLAWSGFGGDSRSASIICGSALLLVWSRRINALSLRHLH